MILTDCEGQPDLRVMDFRKTEESEGGSMVSYKVDQENRVSRSVIHAFTCIRLTAFFNIYEQYQGRAALSSHDDVFDLGTARLTRWYYRLGLGVTCW